MPDGSDQKCPADGFMYLNSVNGIGPITKNKLLRKFKNIKNIKAAEIDDLTAIKGINNRIAKDLISYKN